MKKLLAFDLDDTLAVSKSPISSEMADLLKQVLVKYQVCIITGGSYEQIQKQVVNNLNLPPELLQNLHLMPTCGTRYYVFNDNKWQLQYKEDLTNEQKDQIKSVVETHARNLGLWETNPDGEIIEDRLSQITYSALGQLASPEKKYQWAAENKEKRLHLRDLIAQDLPDLEIRVGGTTSIDITKKGVDKSYGMSKLLQANKLNKSEILFFGDKLDEGGNDYPVKKFGIDCIAVDGWETTAYAIKGVLGVSK